MDFDDLLYLFGPIAWLDRLPDALVGAAVIGPVPAALTWWRIGRSGAA